MRTRGATRADCGTAALAFISPPRSHPGLLSLTAKGGKLPAGISGSFFFSFCTYGCFEVGASLSSGYAEGTASV